MSCQHQAPRGETSRGRKKKKIKRKEKEEEKEEEKRGSGRAPASGYAHPSSLPTPPPTELAWTLPFPFRPRDQPQGCTTRYDGRQHAASSQPKAGDKTRRDRTERAEDETNTAHSIASQSPTRTDQGSLVYTKAPLCGFKRTLVQPRDRNRVTIEASTRADHSISRHETPSKPSSLG